MKILIYQTSAAVRRGQRGSAVVVVFILLTLMVMLTLANALALHRLRQEMRLIEKRQLKKFVVPVKSPVERPVPVEPTAKPDA